MMLATTVRNIDSPGNTKKFEIAPISIALFSGCNENYRTQRQIQSYSFIIKEIFTSLDFLFKSERNQVQTGEL
jgi:hypothetical protein